MLPLKIQAEESILVGCVLPACADRNSFKSHQISVLSVLMSHVLSVCSGGGVSLSGPISTHPLDMGSEGVHPDMRYNGIRSPSGQYASYWNAFLLVDAFSGGSMLTTIRAFSLAYRRNYCCKAVCWQWRVPRAPLRSATG